MSEPTVATPKQGEKGQPVEGQPGVWWCGRHAKVQTRLRCGRCETPICPKCTKYGPTGARCPACISNKGTHLYQVSPQQYALAAVVAVVLGSVLGFVASFASILVLFYAPAAGTIVGKAISQVTGGKRGMPLAVIACIGLVLGAFIPVIGAPLALLNVVPNPDGVSIVPLLGANISDPFVWLYAALAVPGAWYWLRN